MVLFLRKLSKKRTVLRRRVWTTRFTLLPMKTAPYWNDARAALQQDKALRGVIAARPTIQLQSRGTAFATLARAIVGQQISVKAAQSVWKRVVAACAAESGASVNPSSVARLDADALRACGLSGMKAGYVLDLAAHFLDGRIQPRAFAEMRDEVVIETLITVKGIGRWSAQMFLMFHLLRPDVWPVDDLGLRNGIDLLWPQKAARTKADYAICGEQFAPWKSVACWYVWRALEPLPDDY
jgi:DNA-3-methyladenine glycosylase II